MFHLCVHKGADANDVSHRPQNEGLRDWLRHLVTFCQVEVETLCRPGAAKICYICMRGGNEICQRELGSLRGCLEQSDMSDVEYFGVPLHELDLR